MEQTTSPKIKSIPQQLPVDDEEDEIDIGDLLLVLWSKVLYIVVAALLGGVLMLAYSVFMVTPKYTSTTTMYVNTGNLTLGSITATISSSELSTSEKLVDLYITILNSRETLDEVSKESGLNYSYDTMRSLVSASSGDASGVFTVSVSSEDPNEAELIANTIAEVLPVRISDIVDGTSTRVIEYAVVASRRSTPSYTKNLAIGMLAGFVLSTAVLVVLYLVDSSKDNMIHSSDELAELYPDFPILATITDMRLTRGEDYTYGSYYAVEPEKKEKKPENKKGASLLKRSKTKPVDDKKSVAKKGKGA